MKPGLSLKVSQHLSLTPQLQQSIRLLQLSSLELSQEVENMLDENPFLELAQEEAESESFGLRQTDAVVSVGDSISEAESSQLPAGSGDAETVSGEAEVTDWEGDGTHDLAPDDTEWGGDATTRNKSQETDPNRDATDWTHVQETLQQHLHGQTSMLRLERETRAALHFLIESLNEDGYLEDTLEDLTESLKPQSIDQQEELLHHFTVALNLLQNFDPPGVGAHDLGECLRLQIRYRLRNTQDEATRKILKLALLVCQQPMELIARRDSKRLLVLCAGMQAGEAQLRAALSLIAKLEPKPGRPFVEVERNIVVPDVIVSAHKKGPGGAVTYRVQINPDVMPKLRVNDVYASALRSNRNGTKGKAKESPKDSSRDAAGHASMQQSLQEARWFISSIMQRYDTILRVAKAIVDRQKSFLAHGEIAMRPLVLREIADELGLHESTISRVTTAKYMATPQGTFELKYFFGSGLGTESGGNTSSTAVRALIKQFIAAESPAKPLSDSQLSDMLKEQGIDCARRTVAKYREGLKIPVATLRKTL